MRQALILVDVPNTVEAVHDLLRTSWIAFGLGFATACGSGGDSDTSTSASQTGSTSGAGETEPAATTTTEGDATSTGGETTGDSSGGDETTEPPAPECGGECLADVVASAYNTCETDLGLDFPCDAPTPCAPAVAQCDSDGENCTFGAGDGDAYVESVVCILEGLRAGDAGRYGLDNEGGASRSRSVLNIDVQTDGSVQTLSSTDLGEDEFITSLDDSDVPCIQASLAGIDSPTDASEAIPVSFDIRLAISGCGTPCLGVFEGFVDFPEDLACL